MAGKVTPPILRYTVAVVRLIALIATAAVAWFGLSASIHQRQPQTALPRFLDVRVAGGTIVDSPQKSAHPAETHVTDTGTVRLIARVEGIDRLDVVVSINSRTDLGHFSARVHSGLVTIDATLPEAGSQWLVPGGGVSGAWDMYTVPEGEGFILQITGTAGEDAYGHPITVAGPGVRVMRQD